jgi:hypothetical protein
MRGRSVFTPPGIGPGGDPASQEDKMQLGLLKRLMVIALMAFFVGLPCRPAAAQSLPVSDTITMYLQQWEALGPHWKVVDEYRRSFRSATKVKKLLGFAKTQFGIPGPAWPESGFSVRYRVRFEKPGTSGELWLKTLVIPVFGQGRAGQTAALELSYYESTPSLALMRLVVRQDPTFWHVTEYAYCTNNKIEELAAVKGHALVRSTLKLLEKKSPDVHTSLRAALDETATQPVWIGLKRVLDPREPAIGQGEMLISTAAFTSASVQVDYLSGKVTGAIDASNDLRFNRNDSALLQQIKTMLRDALKGLAKDLGKKLIEWFIKWLGW